MPIGARFNSRTRAKVSRSLTTAFNESTRATMSPMSSRPSAASGNSVSEQLHAAANAGQRIPNFVRDHRRHFAERRQRRLSRSRSSCALRSVMS